MKACIYCREYLPLEFFYKDATRTDGHRSSCKACEAAPANTRLARETKYIAGLLREWKPLVPNHE